MRVKLKHIYLSASVFIFIWALSSYANSGNSNINSPSLIETSACQDVFISGLDDFISFSASEAGEKGVVFSFNCGGKETKLVSLWYNGGLVVAVEDGSGKKTLIFKNGSLAMSSSLDYSYPKIGFNGQSESVTNRYLIGAHDFTNDGEKDIILAVNDGNDGIAVFVFSYTGLSWKPIGEMVTIGKGLGGCRVFRQAVTMKDAAGVLYTWTCRGDSFDFLSSDHRNNPRLLF